MVPSDIKVILGLAFLVIGVYVTWSFQQKDLTQKQIIKVRIGFALWIVFIVIVYSVFTN